ncbi:MAG: pentapeptide repeat-containing protein [Actinomycetota bacterium]
MPWVDVDEPYTKPPRLQPIDPPGDWSGSLAIDRGWAELVDVVAGPDPAPDLAGCTELTVTESVVTGLTGVEAGLTIEARRSRLGDADLSQASIRSLIGVRLDGCKLTGTDLAGARLTDVELRRCSLRYTNLRMARLERVRFVECTLDEVDAYEAEATDVEFVDTALNEVSVDRLRAERVDLRGATSLSLTAIGSLAGCLIDETKLMALAYPLAFAAGLGIERDPIDEPG